MTKMLVTRPEPDAAATLARLQALDIAAVAAPLMMRETLPVSLPDADGFAAIVLTSANAVRALGDRAALERFRALPVLAVGDHTAREAAAAGFERVSSAAGALDDLVNAIRISGLTGPLLHVTGRHQSGDLAQRLAPLGIMVVTVKLYDMVAVDTLPPAILADLAEGNLAAVLLYSRRTAEIFARCALTVGEQRRRRIAMLCLSEQVAAPLLDARWSRIQLADRPDEDAMMALALTFARDQSEP